jgi:hypothetical protein
MTTHTTDAGSMDSSWAIVGKATLAIVASSVATDMADINVNTAQ